MNNQTILSDADYQALSQFQHSALPASERDERLMRLVQNGYLEPDESEIIRASHAVWESHVASYKLTIKGLDAMTAHEQHRQEETDKEAKRIAERKDDRLFSVQTMIVNCILSALLGAAFGVLGTLFVQSLS